MHIVHFQIQYDSPTKQFQAKDKFQEGTIVQQAAPTHRRRLWVGAARARAPNNWETPMISSVIDTFPPIFYFHPQYFWQVYVSAPTMSSSLRDTEK